MSRRGTGLRALVGYGCVAATLAGVHSASAGAQSAIRQRSAYEDLQMFGQVLNQIRVNHPDSVEAHELFLAAIEGMIAAADPHSYVIPSVRLQPDKEKAWSEGKLHPVPISFAFVGGAPVVVNVLAGTSASEMGIIPGDELIAINGVPVSARSADELMIGLSGARNSRVRLMFERRRSDGSLVTLERPVKRERAEEGTAVPVATMLDSSTGYVRVTTFVGERVADDLHGALERLERTGMRRLVLDLRDNGGGSVGEAAQVAGEFLPRGTVVYTAAGRKADVADTGRVKRSFWRSERRYPIVVLVNAGTASASELVAGALQDHDRALIVGRPTFGKSLMMRGFPMSDGSVLVLVIGHVRTPCGRVVQRQYRSISRREYYRLARAERDTVGRPSCRTGAGRTVYGGGGIYPDVVMAELPPVPAWLARVEEEQLPFMWSGSYVDGAGPELRSLEAFASAPLPASALADFRAFATRQGVPIPTDADPVLQAILVRSVAFAKWGSEGGYHVDARRDGSIREAMGSFGRAALLSGPR